jgi:uncharacterized HAD superfamily protein
MVLGLDIDGVVADFLSPFLNLLEREIGKGPIVAESLMSIDFTEHPVLTKEAVETCSETVKRDPDFWNRLDSLLTQPQWLRLEELNRKERLVFITHRSGHQSYDIHGVTVEWLQRRGITDPKVHLAQEHKSVFVEELRIGLFVDDNYEVCQEVAENTAARVFMPHHHYNRRFSHPRVQRIMQFNEIFVLADRRSEVGSQKLLTSDL